MTYFEIIKKNQIIAKKLNKDPELIRLLVLELSHLDGASFLAKINDELSNDEIIYLQTKINRYLIDNEPLQYIVGYTYFFGYKMIVDDAVLIPRPETEELVGYVLEAYDEMFKDKKITVADIGTGSGAIAIALAKEEKNFAVFASDISEKAINVAKVNAKANDAKVEFIVGDMLEPFVEKNIKIDILVSNPPYIPTNEYVEPIVKDNEPHVALYGGLDGMFFYENILKNASKILSPQAIIAFEHGYNKRNEIQNLVHSYFPKASVETIKDMQGKDRITIIKINN